MKPAQRRGLTLLIPSLLLACDPAGGGDTDGGSDGSTGGTTSASDTDASSDESSSTSANTTSSTTSASTTAPEPDPTSVDESSSGGETDGEAIGFCVGLDPNGHFAEVLSREDAQIDLSCSDDPEPCEGDIFGTWTYETTCGQEALASIWTGICDGASETVISATVEGTLTLNDDDTYERSAVAVTERLLIIDVESCLGETCEGFESILEKEAGTLAVCVDGKGGCECVIETVEDETFDGLYENEGGELSFQVGDDEVTVSVCAEGDRMQAWTEQYALTFTDEPCSVDADCEAALGDAYTLSFCEAVAE